MLYTRTTQIRLQFQTLILKYNRTISVIKHYPRVKVYNKSILRKVCSLGLFKSFGNNYCIFTNQNIQY